jgi:hypothetical protein
MGALGIVIKNNWVNAVIFGGREMMLKVSLVVPVLFPTHKYAH